MLTILVHSDPDVTVTHRHLDKGSTRKAVTPAQRQNALDQPYGHQRESITISRPREEDIEHIAETGIERAKH